MRRVERTGGRRTGRRTIIHVHARRNAAGAIRVVARAPKTELDFGSGGRKIRVAAVIQPRSVYVELSQIAGRHSPGLDHAPSAAGGRRAAKEHKDLAALAHGRSAELAASAEVVARFGILERAERTQARRSIGSIGIDHDGGGARPSAATRIHQQVNLIVIDGCVKGFLCDGGGPPGTARGSGKDLDPLLAQGRIHEDDLTDRRSEPGRHHGERNLPSHAHMAQKRGKRAHRLLLRVVVYGSRTAPLLSRLRMTHGRTT